MVDVKASIKKTESLKSVSVQEIVINILSQRRKAHAFAKELNFQQCDSCIHYIKADKKYGDKKFCDNCFKNIIPKVERRVRRMMDDNKLCICVFCLQITLKKEAYISCDRIVCMRKKCAESKVRKKYTGLVTSSERDTQPGDDSIPLDCLY